MTQWNKVYPDTCVFLDYLAKDRPHAADAEQLFMRALGCEFNIVVSDWTLYEMKAMFSDLNAVKMFLGVLNKKIVWVKKSPEDIAEAKRMSPDHFQDALHVILAKKADSDVLVTRNLQHFTQYKDLIRIKFPEDI